MSQGARGPVYPSCWPDGRVPRVVRAGGYRGRGIPGTTQPSHIPAYWYCQGPTIPRTGVICVRWHSRALQAPPHTSSSHSAYALLDPIRARFSIIYPKVSHKPGVSPKIAHEACHTPCFKKPAVYHDLEFPGFTVLPAFSHKE